MSGAWDTVQRILALGAFLGALLALGAVGCGWGEKGADTGRDGGLTGAPAPGPGTERTETETETEAAGMATYTFPNITGFLSLTITPDPLDASPVAGNTQAYNATLAEGVSYTISANISSGGASITGFTMRVVSPPAGMTAASFHTQRFGGFDYNGTIISGAPTLAPGFNRAVYPTEFEVYNTNPANPIGVFPTPHFTLNITVLAPPEPIIVGLSDVTGEVGTALPRNAGRFYVDASNQQSTNVSAAVSPALPAGLRLEAGSVLQHFPSRNVYRRYYSIAGTPQAAVNAVYTITATETLGGAGYTATDTFRLQITNPPPTISGLRTSWNAAVDRSFLDTFTASAGNASGGVPSVTVSPRLPDGLALRRVSATGTTASYEVSGIPTRAAPRRPYTVTVRDSNGSQSYTVYLTIGADTRSPRIAPGAIAAITGRVGTAITPQRFTVTDAGAPLRLRLPTLPQGITAALSGGVVTISGTPTAEYNGIAAFTVFDAADNPATIVGTAAIGPANDTPTITGLPSSRNTLQNDAIDVIRFIVRDADSGSVTITASNLPSGITISSGGALVSGEYRGAIRGTPSIFGAYNSVITVTDNDGGKTTRRLRWLIDRATNTPPRIIGGGDVGVFTGDDLPEQTLVVTAASNVLSIRVTLAGAPAGTGLSYGQLRGVQAVTIRGSRGTIRLSGTVTAGAGNYDAVITATTNFDVSASKTIGITVSAAPVAARPYARWQGTAPPLRDGRYELAFDQGIARTYTLLGFTDKVGARTIQAAMSSGAAGLGVTPDTAQAVRSQGVAFAIGGTGTAPGSYARTLTLTDDAGVASTPLALRLVVSANTAPVIGAIARQTATAGTAMGAVPVRIDNYPPGESVTLTYALDNGALNDIGMYVDKVVTPEAQADGVAEYLKANIPAGAAAGDYTITITADDGYNAAVSIEWTLHINRPRGENLPTIDPVDRLVFQQGVAGIHSFAVTDGDDETSKTVRCVVTGLPALMNVQGGTLASGAWTVDLADKGNVVIRNTAARPAGEFPCQLTASIVGAPHLTITEAFVVEVSGSVVPDIEAISDLSVTIGVAITAIPIVVDNLPADESVTIAVTGLPSGGGLSYRSTPGGGRQAGEIVGAPAGDAGAHDITITATDAAGNADTETFTITYVLPVSGEVLISGFGDAQLVVGASWSDVLDTVRVVVPAGRTATVSLSGGSAIGLGLSTTNIGAGNTLIVFSGTARGSGDDNAVTLTVTPSAGASVTASATFTILATGRFPTASVPGNFFDYQRLDTVNIPITVTAQPGSTPYLAVSITNLGLSGSGYSLIPNEIDGVTVSTGYPQRGEHLVGLIDAGNGVWTTSIAGQVTRTANLATYRVRLRTSYDINFLRDSEDKFFTIEIEDLAPPRFTDIEPQRVRQGDNLFDANIEIAVSGVVDVFVLTDAPTWATFVRTATGARLSGRVPPRLPVGDYTLQFYVNNTVGNDELTVTLRVDYALKPPTIAPLPRLRVRQGEAVAYSVPVIIPFQGTGVTAAPMQSGALPRGMTTEAVAGNRDTQTYPVAKYGGVVAGNAQVGDYAQTIRYTDDQRRYNTVHAAFVVEVVGAAAEPIPPSGELRGLGFNVYINTNRTAQDGAQVFDSEEDYSERVIGDIQTFTGRVKPADFFGVEGDSRAYVRLWNRDGALDAADFYLRQIKIDAKFVRSQVIPTPGVSVSGALFNGYVREAAYKASGAPAERYLELECYGQLHYWADVLGRIALPPQGAGSPKSGLIAYVYIANERVKADRALIDTPNNVFTDSPVIIDYSVLAQRGIAGYRGSGGERVPIMRIINELAQLSFGAIWDGAEGNIIHHSGAHRTAAANQVVKAVIQDATVPAERGAVIASPPVEYGTDKGRYVYTQIAASANNYGPREDPLVFQFPRFNLAAGASRTFPIAFDAEAVVRSWPQGAQVTNALNPVGTGGRPDVGAAGNFTAVLTYSHPLEAEYRITNTGARPLSFRPGAIEVADVEVPSAESATTISLPDDIADGDAKDLAEARVQANGEKLKQLDITAVQNEDALLPWLTSVLMHVNQRRPIYRVAVDASISPDNARALVTLNAGDFVRFHAPSIGVANPIGCWVESKECRITVGGRSVAYFQLAEAAVA